MFIIMGIWPRNYNEWRQCSEQWVSNYPPKNVLFFKVSIKNIRAHQVVSTQLLAANVPLIPRLNKIIRNVHQWLLLINSGKFERRLHELTIIQREDRPRSLQKHSVATDWLYSHHQYLLIRHSVQQMHFSNFLFDFYWIIIIV